MYDEGIDWNAEDECQHPRCDALNHTGVNAVLPCPWKTEDPVPECKYCHDKGTINEHHADGEMSTIDCFNCR